MAYQTGRWWSGNAWTSKRFSKRWELFGNVWKRLFLIVGDQHCLRSTFVCLKHWKPILCEATKPKDESVFDTRFEASVGFIKRSCRGAVRVGLKPIAASHFRLFFWKFYFNRLAENQKMRVINLDSPHTKLVSKVSGKQMWISDNADLQQWERGVSKHFQTVPTFCWISLMSMHSRSIICPSDMPSLFEQNPTYIPYLENFSGRH